MNLKLHNTCITFLELIFPKREIEKEHLKQSGRNWCACIATQEFVNLNWKCT